MSDSEHDVRLLSKIKKLNEEIKTLKREKEDLGLENEELGRALQKFRLVADFAHDWEMWFRPDSSFEYVSPSCQSITGYAAGELIDNPKLLYDIIFPEDAETFRNFIKDSLNFISIRQSLNFRILTRTKQIRWCEMKSKAVYDSRGKYLGQRASVNDVTRLMQALGEIKSLSDGKEYDSRMKHRYIRALEDKDRELVSHLMSISSKNETLQYIKKTIINHLSTRPGGETLKFRKIIEYIDGSLHGSETWDSFKIHFEKVHPGFFNRILDHFPQLTTKDLRLCSYLRLQLATKEIAGLMNITIQSAEISRVRLRRKLDLNRSINLVDYISKI